MIDKLIRYAGKEGFKVRLDGDYSTVVWQNQHEPDYITIRSHKNKDREVYDLLHELGHHILRKDKRAYAAKYPVTVYAEKMELTKGINKYKRRNNYAVETLKEEYEAWDVGLQIARKLRLDIDLEDYRNYSSKSVLTYVRFFGKK